MNSRVTQELSPYQINANLRDQERLGIFCAGPGTNYPDVQDAVDAASGSATAATPQLVVNCGATPTWVPVDNVYVINATPGWKAENPLLEDMPGERLASIPTVWTKPMVCIRSDMPGPGWAAADSTVYGTAISSLQYAARYGFPVSFGVRGDIGMGDARYMTIAQLRAAAWTAGVSMESHSHDHEAADQPTTAAEMAAQTLGMFSEIDALQDTAFESDAGRQVLGFVASGIFQPGAWTNNNYIDTEAKSKLWPARVLRQTSEWCMNYLGYATPARRYFGKVAVSQSQGAVGTDTALNYFARVPVHDVVVNLDGDIQETGATREAACMSSAQFKALVDLLVGMRDSGLIHLVSARTYFTGVKGAEEWQLTKGGNIGRDSGSDYANFAAMSGDGWSASVAGSSSVAIGNDAGDYYLRMTKDGTNVCKLQHEFPQQFLHPGRVHCVKFNSRWNSGVSTEPTVQILWVFFDSDNGFTGEINSQTLDLGADGVWTTHHQYILVPSWARRVYIKWKITSTGGVLDLDNVYAPVVS